MSDLAWNPLHLDVPAFARAGAHLEGAWAAADLTRFAEQGGDGWPAVHFALDGEEVPVLGGAPEVWLTLRVTAEAEAECQRCLQPVRLPLQLDLRTRFVRSEDEAAALDAEMDDDVLVLSRNFNLRDWVEDELLLALPIVPMHAQCPMPLPMPDAADSAESAESEAPREHPFAALAALRGKRGGGTA